MASKHIPHVPHPLRNPTAERQAPTPEAERLRTIRLALGLTQIDFGAELGVRGMEISRYETGTIRPPVAVLKLAEYMLAAQTPPQKKPQRSQRKET